LPKAILGNLGFSFYPLLADLSDSEGESAVAGEEFCPEMIIIKV
jgi:hypothetical protein